MRADYLSGRTALHFAAVNGHVRCIRLVVADFVPSTPYEAIHAHTDADKGAGSNVSGKHEHRYPVPFFLILIIMHFLKQHTIAVNSICYICLATGVKPLVNFFCLVCL